METGCFSRSSPTNLCVVGLLIMQTQDSKQFENWITSVSALTEQEVIDTRRVMHTLHAIRLSLVEQGVRATPDNLVDLTRMVLEHTCKDT